MLMAVAMKTVVALPFVSVFQFSDETNFSSTKWPSSGRVSGVTTIADRFLDDYVFIFLD
jgi:hypothetical protein